MTRAEIIAMPKGLAKLSAILEYQAAVQQRGPGQCPKCGEQHQVQLIDAMHHAGPWWRCRKCAERFHTTEPKP